MNKNIFLLILVFIFSSYIAEAATLHGNIYDFELNLVKNSIVIVDSEPKQTIVAKEGEYSFTLNPGSYIVTAFIVDGNEITAKAEEKIVINQEGDFVLDLIVFPSFGDLEELLNQSEIEVVDPFEEQKFPYWIFSIFVILILAGIWYKKFYKKKEKKKHEDEENKNEDYDGSAKIIDFIKKEGGRVNQRDIRKQSNLSEAKISLLISELESKGLVKKIKKGRGNIIVLEKK